MRIFFVALFLLLPLTQGCVNTRVSAPLAELNRSAEPREVCVDVVVEGKNKTYAKKIANCFQRKSTALHVEVVLDTPRKDVEVDEFVFVLQRGGEPMHLQRFKSSPRTQLGVKEDLVYRYKQEFEIPDFEWQAGEYQVRYLYREKSDLSRVVTALGGLPGVGQDVVDLLNMSGFLSGTVSGAVVKAFATGADADAFGSIMVE